MVELRDSETRRRIILGIVLAVLATGVLVGGVAAYRFVLNDIVNCSPPSQDELRAQEAFVRAHLSNVSDVELGVLDCDDDGAGYVSFTTELSATVARAAFLADRACSLSTDPNGSDVTCTSAGVPVYLSFEEAGRLTDGELRVP